ncbi:hypothetical protein CHS0354_001043 [Potamilus streckersoni]|uniref:DUF4773 domain-containing protein n=1 Tax=Potamilus streckersoni TaxID=2493646 RepID=A0AAE0SUP3_9BIVA|nr:hypothetical protein CHS0354_001043 [Potamilus streckersoni]
MARIPIFILLVGVWMGVTAGRFVLDETKFPIEDEEKIVLSEDGLTADSDVDLDAAVLRAILKEEISLEELLGEGIVQDLEAKLSDSSLTDSSWSRCLSINTKILGIRVNTQVCVTIEWLSTNMGIRVTIQIGSYTYVKEISVSNPPSLCYGIPGIKLLKICVQFYNINISEKSGCVRLKISFFSWNIGCFNFLHTGKEERLSQHPHTGQRIAKSETVKKPSSVMFF